MDTQGEHSADEYVRFSRLCVCAWIHAVHGVVSTTRIKSTSEEPEKNALASTYNSKAPWIHTEKAAPTSVCDCHVCLCVYACLHAEQRGEHNSKKMKLQGNTKKTRLHVHNIYRKQEYTGMTQRRRVCAIFTCVCIRVYTCSVAWWNQLKNTNSLRKT